MPSAFSMPPMRCSRPGVPGMAHGLASVCGSRREWLEVAVFGLSAGVANANPADRSGRSATSGIRHGSEPLARYPSDSRITGVR